MFQSNTYYVAPRDGWQLEKTLYVDGAVLLVPSALGFKAAESEGHFWRETRALAGNMLPEEYGR